MTVADPDITRYLNIHSAYFPGFTAAGDKLVFLSDKSGIAQLWQVGDPGIGGEPARPDQLTDGEERVMAVYCAPPAGGDLVIFTRDVGGNEKAQLWLLNPATGTTENLTTGFEEAMHLFGAWSEDGRTILFAANRRDPGIFDLYLQPIGGEAKMIWRNDEQGFVEDMLLSPDGWQVIFGLNRSSFDVVLYEVDLTSGRARRLTPEGQSLRFFDLAYNKEGRSIFMITDWGSDYLYLAEMNLESLEVVPVKQLEWDMDFTTLSPDGRSLAFVVNVGGATELRLLDLESGRQRTASPPAAKPGVHAMMDWTLNFSPGGDRLAFSYTAATRSSDIYIWDLKADAIRAVTRSSHAGLPTDSFVQPELIHYPTFDEVAAGQQRQIPAWFYRPQRHNQGPRPVIVMVHGGPEGQFQPYFHPLIQYFVQAGYAVLAPNVRGSTGYGKAYSHLDDVEKRMDSVADLAHAAAWLKGQEGIDGERIVVYGGSYGGFMVLAALTNYPALWAAGVDIVGISNFVTFLENTSDYRRAHREAEYGRLDRDRDFLERISPNNHLDLIQAPLMVIHGANDPRVPLSEAQQLVSALERRDVPVEFLVFDDEGHGLARLANKLVAYPAVVAFLDRVLRDVAGG